MQFQPSPHSFASPEEAEEYGVIGITTAVVGGSLAAGALATIVVLWLAPTFLIVPAVVKAFKPDWSYKRRVAAGIGVTAVANFTKDLFTEDDGWF
jgi:hypothetical protein